MSRPFPRFHLLEISLFRWYGFLCGDNYILFEEKFVEVGNQTVKKGRNSRNFYLDRFPLPFFFLVKFFSQLIFLWHGIELRLAPTLLASIVLYTGPVKKKKKRNRLNFKSRAGPTLVSRSFDPILKNILGYSNVDHRAIIVSAASRDEASRKKMIDLSCLTNCYRFVRVYSNSEIFIKFFPRRSSAENSVFSRVNRPSDYDIAR